MKGYSATQHWGHIELIADLQGAMVKVGEAVGQTEARKGERNTRLDARHNNPTVGAS